MPQSFRRTARQSARQCAAAQPDRLLAARRAFQCGGLCAAAGGRRLAVCPQLAAGRRPRVQAAVRRAARLRIGTGAAAALAAGGPALSRRGHADLGLSARCAACCLSAAGFGAVPDGLCRALSAGTGNRRHAGIGASAAVHRQSANCRTDTGRFSRRRQRPADALPGIPAARALARAGQAWPPYAAAAGRVGTGV